MKRILKIGVFAAVFAAMLCACTKEGTGRFKGNYSFKTSGTVYCREKGNNSAETVILKLTDEQGQMDILEAEGNDNLMYVTMNVLSGPMVLFDAVADGKVIKLSPKERVLSIRTGLTATATADLTAVVSGEGRRYDNSVIFNLVYTGTYESLGTEYEIIESDVQCVAKMN